MWAVLGGLCIAIVFYCWERFAIEMVSAAIVAVLLVFFHLFPLETDNPTVSVLLAGFANPALITIIRRLW